MIKETQVISKRRKEKPNNISRSKKYSVFLECIFERNWACFRSFQSCNRFFKTWWFWKPYWSIFWDCPRWNSGTLRLQLYQPRFSFLGAIADSFCEQVCRPEVTGVFISFVNLLRVVNWSNGDFSWTKNELSAPLSQIGELNKMGHTFFATYRASGTRTWKYRLLEHIAEGISHVGGVQCNHGGLYKTLPKVLKRASWRTYRRKWSGMDEAAMRLKKHWSKQLVNCSQNFAGKWEPLKTICIMYLHWYLVRHGGKSSVLGLESVLNDLFETFSKDRAQTMRSHGVSRMQLPWEKMACVLCANSWSKFLETNSWSLALHYIENFCSQYQHILLE